MKGYKEKQYRFIALRVAYLGWDYDGLQSNPNLDDSIENLLRGALQKTRLVDPSDPIKFTKCGRTDKGVSSFDQVMTLCVNSKLPPGSKGVQSVQEALESLHKASLEDQKPEKLKGDISTLDEALQNETEPVNEDEALLKDEYDYPSILNRVLPREIRVLAWSPLEGFTFSARHDCNSREYRYYFPKGKLDVSIMASAAKQFCGLNDYRNFCKINISNCKTFVRRIDSFEIFPCENSVAGDSYNLYYAKIVGSGFVYHQVRSMMSMLFLIGLKREQPNIITSLLDVATVQGKPCFGLARETALSLYRTRFEADLKWQVSSEGCSKMLVTLQTYWSDLATRAQMTRELIKAIETDSEIRINPSAHEHLVKNKDVSNCIEVVADMQENMAMHGMNRELFTDNFPVDWNRYKPVLERPRGKRLEEHFEHFESKKMRIEAGSTNIKMPQSMETEVVEQEDDESSKLKPDRKSVV